jgi:hypothetical protein
MLNVLAITAGVTALGLLGYLGVRAGLGGLAGWLDAQVDRLNPFGPTSIPVLTYADAVAFFVTDRPDDPRVGAGALVVEPHARGLRVTQVFLDAENRPVLRADGRPYGRAVVARRLDDELERALDGRRMLLFPGAETAPGPAPSPGVDGDRPAAAGRVSSRGPGPDPTAGRGRGRRPSIAVKTFTYPAAIGYFAAARPDDPRVCKGALLRRKERRGYVIDQLFLDARDRPVCGAGGEPYGRVVQAQALDDELTDAFGAHNLIIVH